MSLNLRLRTPVLLVSLSFAAALATVACTPKDDSDDDGGASTSADEGTAGGSTTSGEGLTTGDSDPSNPTGVSGGTAPQTTTSPGTSSPGTASDTEGSDEATSNGTNTSVGTTVDPTDSDSDTDSGEQPPVACEGEPQPIVAETIMAFTQDQIPEDPNPTSFTSGSSGGEPIPPDTLHLKFSNQAFTCADPSAVLECGSKWEFEIIIPPESQFPGLYNLAGSGVFATAFETGEKDGNECSGGGGAGFDGTLEIVSITDLAE